MFYHPYVGVWLRVRACNPRLGVSVESEVVVFLEELFLLHCGMVIGLSAGWTRVVLG